MSIRVAVVLAVYSLVMTILFWLSKRQNRRYEAKKEKERIAHCEQRTRDTQKNVYGRITNALLAKDKGLTRGVKVHPLGNYQQEDIYTINLFWYNEHGGLSILGIQIFEHSIHVESMSAPCPQGSKRDYQTVNLNDDTVEGVISDVKVFIAETYMAYEKVASGVR